MNKEIVVKLKTSDKKTIYGILRGEAKNTLVVLVHGLCGNMNEAMHYNAARFFDEHYISTFRFNLYSWQGDARKLHECSLKTHGQDIDTVLEYLQKRGFKNIFLVGHSYGLPSILHCKNQSYKAVVSWDGSITPNQFFKKLPAIKKYKGRILDEGYLVIMSEAMVKESNHTDSLALLKKLTKPIKFITIPGETTVGNLAAAKKMMAVVKTETELKVIKGANHNFTQEGKQEELYSETLSWIQKFL